MTHGSAIMTHIGMVLIVIGGKYDSSGVVPLFLFISVIMLHLCFASYAFVTTR